MALAHTSKLFAVQDAKIAKLTSDPSGGSPVFATSIDVPGIKSVEVSFEINNVELRGDNTRLDSDSVLGGISVSFEHAKVSLDVLAAMIGGTVTDSGTTPNQVATLSRLSTDAFNYFKLEAKTPTNGVDFSGGDAHLIIWKLKLTDYSIGFAEEDYYTFEGEASGSTLLSNNKIFDIVLNETQAAVA